MIDFLKVLRETNAYKIIECDKRANKLSHAYLFVCDDGVFLRDYLKVLAKIIMCDEGVPCLRCRNCTLLENNTHSDVIFYPKGDKGIVTEDITGLIEESFIKPIEGDKKLFVLQNAETMNGNAQNKLLKTLEEPPKNVHLLIGATNEFSLLPTIKSRVKKIEINNLSNELIFESLSDECKNITKLKEAVGCGNGTLGKAYSLYGDEGFFKTLDLVKDMLINMRSSRDVLEYSTKIEKSKIAFEDLFSVVELVFEDMLYITENKKELVKNGISTEIFKENGYKRGAILYALESINEGKKRKSFNANEKMLSEWLLFRILEGKYKWQKLSE